MINKTCLYFLSFVFLLSLAPTHSMAQETGRETEGAVLEEILVSAQKRTQSLQDIPFSISAFSASDIEDAGWRDINELQHADPSVVIGGESLARPYLFIRGVGTRKFDIGTDGSVGVFIDEVYNTRFNTALTGILDLERIEVLKGPQGTLYGRNTIGGAIAMYTQKPSDEFEGRIKAGFGSDGYYQVGASVSGSTIDGGLGGRLSVMTSDEDGILTDTITGRDDNNSMSSARVALLATPSERLEISVTGEINQIDSDASLVEPTPGPTLVSPFLPPDLVTSVVDEAAEDPFSNAFSNPGFVDRDNNQFALRVKWFGEALAFTSISSLTDEDYTEFRDFDGFVLDTWNHDIEQSSTQYSQEFRFNSADGSAVRWVAGIYYFRDDASRTDNFYFGSDSALAPPPPLFPGLTQNDNIAVVDLDTTNYAVYGQANFNLTDRLGLTLGLRYSDDEKKFVYSTSTNTPGFPVLLLDFSVGDTLQFDSVDPRVSLDFQVNDDVMVYGTYASGYKSGGMQYAVYVPEVAARGFDNEELEMVELGVKSRLLDDRVQLNAALYRYDYKDQQVQGIELINGQPTGLTQNAAASTMTGLEVDLRALVSERLELNFGYTWQDAEFDEFQSLDGDRSGNKMPSAPENSIVAGLNYGIVLGSTSTLTFDLNYSWKDDHFLTFDNTPEVLQESYGVVNLGAWWQSAEDRLRVRVFCSNCSDEEYLLNAVEFPVPLGGGARLTWAKQRRYGIEMSYNF